MLQFQRLIELQKNGNSIKMTVKCDFRKGIKYLESQNEMRREGK